MNETRFIFDLLGGDVEFVAYDLDSNHANFIMDNIHMEGLRLEKIFNFYDEESEVSKLNRERKIKPSSDFFSVLSISIDFAKRFPKYNHLLGKSILRLKENDSQKIDDISLNDIFISEELVELKNSDILIDLGRIAKGYIADKLIQEMKDEGISSGFIDARGDLITFGEHYEVIEIPSPRNNLHDIVGIKLEDSALATSGNEFQGNHILNEGDFSNISIISKDLMHADLFSTICFTMTIEEIKKFANNKIKVHAVSKNNEEFDFNGFLEMERKIVTKEKNLRKTRAS